MRFTKLIAVCAVVLLAASGAALGGTLRSERLAVSPDPTATLAERAATDAELSTALDQLSISLETSGKADVIARMSVPWAPESLLGDLDALQQRREIAAAADKIKDALDGIRVSLPDADKPYVLLTIDPSGLKRLLAVPGLVQAEEASRSNWRRDFVQTRVKLMSESQQQATVEEPKEGGGTVVTPRIVGGTTAGPGVHPFQVGLLTKTIANNYNAQFCGGTLVAERYVVTAAHCSDSIVTPSAEVQVLVGTRSLSSGGTRVNVSNVWVHPSWNTNTNDYDAAVWELATPVTGIPFASLATSQPTVAGQLLRVTGWGSLSYQGSYPYDLQQVDVPFVPTVNGSCQSQRGVTARMICAGQSGKDSCQGDSGGPLTMQDTNSSFTVLAGIVSFGNGCAKANYPGVYANVANTSIKNFITSKIPASNTISFTPSAYTVTEGVGIVTLTVTRSSSTGTASVNFATANGTAVSSSDYAAKSGTLTFAEGVTSRTIDITVANNDTPENPETFTVSLSSPSGASLGAASTATITINDDDVAPASVSFASAVYSVVEGTSSITLTVTRSSSIGTASVNYATANGTAVSSSDYTAKSGTVSFAAGVTTRTISISIVNNTTAENPESFTVSLSSPTGATLASPSTATVTIQDDDGTSGVTSLTNGSSKTGLSGTSGSSRYFAITVPAGAASLVFTTSGGSGNVDLYVRNGTMPSRATYDCAANGAGNAHTCTVPAPTPGTYFVMLYGASSYSSVSLRASYTATTPLTNGSAVTQISGSSGTQKFYSITVPQGATNLQISISGGTGDADLYTRLNQLPSSSAYDCRPYLSGNNESCVSATPAPGVYYIRIHAFSAYSGVSLVASYSGGTFSAGTKQRLRAVGSKRTLLRE